MMNVYSNMRRYKNSKSYELEAVRIFKTFAGEETSMIEYTGLMNCIGDIYLKIGGKKDNLERALEIYQESSEILLEICGENSIDYLYSLCDIGDCYLEMKEYDKAKSFYFLVQEKLSEIYGKDSIFNL